MDKNLSSTLSLMASLQEGVDEEKKAPTLPPNHFVHSRFGNRTVLRAVVEDIPDAVPVSDSGRLIVVEDYSGSMSSHYNTLDQGTDVVLDDAKGSAPGVVYVMPFASRSSDLIDASSEDAKEQFTNARRWIGGGTNFMEPLGKIWSLVDGGQDPSKITVIFMTDGECSQWESTASRLKEALPDGSRIIPYFFGTVGGYYGGYGYEQNKKSLSHMAYGAEVQHIQTVQGLKDMLHWATAEVAQQVQAVVVVPSRVPDAPPQEYQIAVYNNGQRTEGTLMLELDEKAAEVLDFENAYLVLGSGNEGEASVTVPMGYTHQRNLALSDGVIAELLTSAIRQIMTDYGDLARGGDADALHKLAVQISELETHIRSTGMDADPRLLEVAQQLREVLMEGIRGQGAVGLARAAFQSVLGVSQSNSNASDKLSECLRKLSSIATNKHRRKVAQATKKMSLLIAKNAAKMKTVLAESQPVLTKLVEERKTPLRDVPDDPLMIEDETKVVHVLLSTPGHNMGASMDAIGTDTLDPTVAAVINNPGAARVLYQTHLMNESMRGLHDDGQDRSLFREGMVPVMAVGASPIERKWCYLTWQVIAGQIMTGYSYMLQMRSGDALLSAIWSLLARGDAEGVRAALVLVPYARAYLLSARVKLNPEDEVTMSLMEVFHNYLHGLNGSSLNMITMSMREGGDNVLTNPYVAAVGFWIAGLYSSNHPEWRGQITTDAFIQCVPALIFEWLRQPLNYRIDSFPFKEKFLRLAKRMGFADSTPPEVDAKAVAAELEPLLRPVGETNGSSASAVNRVRERVQIPRDDMKVTDEAVEFCNNMLDRSIGKTPKHPPYLMPPFMGMDVLKRVLRFMARSLENLDWMPAMESNGGWLPQEHLTALFPTANLSAAAAHTEAPPPITATNDFGFSPSRLVQMVTALMHTTTVTNQIRELTFENLSESMEVLPKKWVELFPQTLEQTKAVAATQTRLVREILDYYLKVYANGGNRLSPFVLIGFMKSFYPGILDQQDLHRILKDVFANPAAQNRQTVLAAFKALPSNLFERDDNKITMAFRQLGISQQQIEERRGNPARLPTFVGSHKFNKKMGIVARRVRTQAGLESEMKIGETWIMTPELIQIARSKGLDDINMTLGENATEIVYRVNNCGILMCERIVFSDGRVCERRKTYPYSWPEEFKTEARALRTARLAQIKND